jgi:hypothetical protein
VRQFRIVICVRFRQSLYVVPWASDGLSTERWVGKSQFSWVPIGQTPLCGSTAKPSEEKRLDPSMGLALRARLRRLRMRSRAS